MSQTRFYPDNFNVQLREQYPAIDKGVGPRHTPKKCTICEEGAPPRAAEKRVSAAAVNQHLPLVFFLMTPWFFGAAPNAYLL